MATLQVYVTDLETRRRAWQWRLATEAERRQPNPAIAPSSTPSASAVSTPSSRRTSTDFTRAAGQDAARVVEIHGTLQEVECLGCGERAPMERALARVRGGEDDPPCRTCGGILKSATISFGQGLVARDLARAQRAAEACDLLLAIGTTLAVYPIAGMVPLAKECGARIVIVNGDATEMDALADALLRGSISEILPRLVPEAR
ncbi:MAG: Sir2 family NAD-dependent protein deacetylase [Myxococcota bacterium]